MLIKTSFTLLMKKILLIQIRLNLEKNLLPVKLIITSILYVEAMVAFKPFMSNFRII